VDENTLFVIFGTCHKPAPRVWNIALRDLRTPLGTVKGAAEVGRLLREDALLGTYVDEWPHRNEHSIELQLPIIQSLLGHGRFEVLSILTGSFHEYMEAGRSPSFGEAAELAERLKEILKAHEGPCVVIAGADLAHIGAQFGDPPPLDASTLEESRQKDGALLETVARMDAAGFFEAVRGEGDRRRICGLAPIYFLLSMLGPCGGEVVGYDQWTDGASSVSFAGVVFS
jgi:AmmeMemoRadiSam system protein B